MNTTLPRWASKLLPSLLLTASWAPLLYQWFNFFSSWATQQGTIKLGLLDYAQSWPLPTPWMIAVAIAGAVLSTGLAYAPWLKRKANALASAFNPVGHFIREQRKALSIRIAYLQYQLAGLLFRLTELFLGSGYRTLTSIENKSLALSQVPSPLKMAILFWAILLCEENPSLSRIAITEFLLTRDEGKRSALLNALRVVLGEEPTIYALMDGFNLLADLAALDGTKTQAEFEHRIREHFRPKKRTPAQ